MYQLRFKDVVLYKVSKFIHACGFKCYLYSSHLYLQFRSLFCPPTHIFNCPLGIPSWVCQRYHKLKSGTEFVFSRWLSVMGDWVIVAPPAERICKEGCFRLWGRGGGDSGFSSMAAEGSCGCVVSWLFSKCQPARSAPCVFSFQDPG